MREEDSGRQLEIEGYSRVETRRSDAAGDKAGGGILVFTKEAKGVKYREKVFKIKEESSNKNNQIVKLLKKKRDKNYSCNLIHL